MYNVVIVDDEPIIVEGLKTGINWENWNCHIAGTASNGLEGLELVRDLKPNMLFSDISMTNMDGLAMVAAIKSEFPDIEVCLLTGFRNFEYAQQAIKLGVTRFLLKPSKIDEIEEAIDAMTRNLVAKGQTGENRKENLWNMDDPVEKYIYDAFVENRPKPKADEEAYNFTDANYYIIKTALKYIYANYASKMSLMDVAEQCYISNWHLSKLLNQYTGKGFFEIINVIRIDKAKELLKTSNAKVQEISEQVGFQDVTHFSRIFKNHVGTSPKDFRAMDDN
ncbi:MAG: response regulator [Lachnospiraceae bacterium]|nr:response regulator [Lachnospiraceae bacterium]